ncbi:prenyltransferase/squalene oxidase repeat-containing protein [Streptomyces sp. NBC_01477]|uniref:prenyltransferase/squalene oxidase repeat-containing protein n=1 Tax=Streptomyces sp. NBC_01477 TaxID=2976015 RepID=UPI002E34ACDD|nr:prenyltransferase/squalene oxidase repeat-containing protein [Streptomyces sp. NBC_01477]
MKIATPARPAALQLPEEIHPDVVHRATSRLVAHVSGRADPDGALRGHCESRVLESALALSLMTRTGAHSPARDRLLAYLRPHRQSADRLDAVLASLAVGGAAGRETGGDSALVGTLASGVLAAAPGFISVRRRLMVYAVLCVLGCPLPADAELPGGGQAPTDPLHSWAAVQQASITLILAGAMGVRNRSTEAALGTLLATDPATTVWEGYALMHLLALHALAGVPGQEETVRRGLETLLRHQRPDGGFPFVLAMDNWCTATGGLALHAAGADPALLRRMTAMLGAHQGGARLRSLSRGAPLTGGWSMSPLVAQNDVDDTSCALELLQAVDPVTHAGAVRRGVDALLAVQGADGGFPTYVAGASSEPCMTAAAVCALAPHPATAPVRDKALAFLADSQHADGSFEPGWSRSRLHSLFRVRLAACTAGQDDPRAAAMAARIEQTVRETQNTDGGWGMQPGDPSDDVSTAYGLIALCYADDPRPLGRALTWLLAQQKADGSYGGPPDMVGPRPFAYHFPLLTDIPVLLALGHVRARLADPQAVLPAVR